MKKLALTLFAALLAVLLASKHADADVNLDGDQYGDLVFFDSSNARIWWRSSQSGAASVIDTGKSAGRLGLLGDFDGGGLTDFTLYNRSTSEFYTLISGGAPETVTVGGPGDIPVPADFSGGGCTNYATFDRRDATWTVADCNGTGAVSFTHGTPGAIPVPGDYDCDGAADAMTYNRADNKWELRRSSDDSTDHFYFGLHGDIPASNDWDGDGCTEAAVYRPSTNEYYYNTSFSTGGVGAANGPHQWGLNGDQMVLTNVDETAAADFAIYRPWENQIYIRTPLGVTWTIPVSASGSSFYSAVNVPTPMSSRPHQPGPARGDWDGDGRSDFVTASVNTATDKTTFSVLHSTGAQSTYVVNDQGDALVPADYNGDGKTQAATVYVRVELAGQQDPPPLRWKWLNPDGSESSVEHGVNGDAPIAGDFDCDGKADKAAVRTQNGFRYWNILHSTGGTTNNYLFGLEGDRVYAADVTGNGCDELVVARDWLGGIFWFYREIGTGSTTDHLFQWGLTGDKELAPADLNGDGRADFVVVRNIGGAWHFFRRFNESSWDVVPFGIAATDVPLSGRYSGVNYSEIGVYRPGSTSSFYVRRHAGPTLQVPWGSASQSLVRPDGTVVAGSSGGGGGGQPGGAGCVATPGTDGDFVDGGGNSLWKPVSSTGKPVILLPHSPYCDAFHSSDLAVTILGSDGAVVAGLEREHCDGANDYRTHHWLNKSASQLDDFAPLTVKVQYHVGSQLVTECRVVSDPHTRYD